MKCYLLLHLIKAGTHSARTSCTTRLSGETASHEERQGPSQLVRVVQLVQVVKLHLIKKGRGPVNSYESIMGLKRDRRW